MGSKSKTIAILSAMLVAAFVGAGTALADEGGVPPFPTVYSGMVYVGGQPGGAGLIVSCSILDWNSAEGEGAEAGEPTNADSEYIFVVAPPDEKYDGETIIFYVNGVQADETDTKHTVDEVTGFDLHIDALPSPGPTSTSANVTTPVPTQTSVGPTSTGGSPVATQTPAATQTSQPTSPPAPPPTPAAGGGGLSGGAVAGIAAGALVLGAITVLALNRISGRKPPRQPRKTVKR